MSDVDIAIGVRGPIVQDKGGSILGRLGNRFIQPSVLPGRQHPGFTIGQLRLHREVRLRQIDGVFVVHCVYFLVA